MLIKTAQWNIGGGKIRTTGDNPKLEQSYSVDGMKEISAILKQHSPDIVTLQETHANSKLNQAEVISERIGLPYFFNDIYDQSHIEAGYGLGQAVISKYPIREHSFDFFYNPHYKVNRPDGSKWISHDKGLSVCQIELPDKTTLVIMTLHLIPFKIFGINPLGDEAKKVRDNIAAKINGSTQEKRFLLQGDFNFDRESLIPLLGDIFIGNTQEALTRLGTTPKGKKYDHIVFNGIQLRNSTVDDYALTDHFPIFAEFEI
ncbi:MAG: endonuclease/exonuclease/phosphatase family protein [Parcubacteria group bacterium]|nr:endonuclease/exonuclease/phosphatase family protein [Parcubacteria group bacterium]